MDEIFDFVTSDTLPEHGSNTEEEMDAASEEGDE